MIPKKWGNLCLSKQAYAYRLGTMEIIIFWHDCILEEKNIKISGTHHTRKFSWWLSPNKMRSEICSHSCIPSTEILPTSFSLYLLPCCFLFSLSFPTSAVSPVFFQTVNCNLGQESIPRYCDFSVYREPIQTFPFSCPCSSRNPWSLSFSSPEPPKKQMVAE